MGFRDTFYAADTRCEHVLNTRATQRWSPNPPAATHTAGRLAVSSPLLTDRGSWGGPGFWALEPELQSETWLRWTLDDQMREERFVGGESRSRGGRPCWRHDPRGQPEHRSLEKVLRGELCRARQRVTHLDSRVSSGQTQGWRGDTGSHRRRAPRQEVGLGLDRRSPGVGRDWDRDLCPPLASARHPHPQWPPRPGLTGLLRAPQASASPSAPLGTFSDVSPSARPPRPRSGRLLARTHLPTHTHPMHTDAFPGFPLVSP